MDGSAKSEGSWNLAGTSWPTLQPNPQLEAHVYKTEPLIDGQGYTSGWWVTMLWAFITTPWYWWVQYQIETSPSWPKLQNLCLALTTGCTKKAVLFLQPAASRLEFPTQGVTKPAPPQLRDLKRTYWQGERRGGGIQLQGKKRKMTGPKIPCDNVWHAGGT